MRELKQFIKYETWDELALFIDANSVFYFHLDEIFTPGKRIIITNEFTNNVHFWTEMDYTSGTPESGSDQEDYDDNYLSGEGTKDYLRNSWKFVVSAGSEVTIETIKLRDPSDTDCETFLFKCCLKTCTNATHGDYFKIEMVDKDGLYYPAGTVLRTFVKNEYLQEGQQSILVNPATQDSMGLKKILPSGVYIYVTYKSIGVSDVNVIVSAEYRY